MGDLLGKNVIVGVGIGNRGWGFWAAGQFLQTLGFNFNIALIFNRQISAAALGATVFGSRGEGNSGGVVGLRVGFFCKVTATKGGIPVVFNGIIGPAGKDSSDCCPFVAVMGMGFDDHAIFFW